MSKQLSLPGYDTLRKQVEAALLEGQRVIEQTKVTTYHKTGELIHKHFIKNTERAGLGKRTVEKLSEDLDIDASTLWRCLQFFRTFPVLGAHRELTWTHYCKLLTISDEKIRLEFMKRAEKGEWTSKELISKIQTEITHPDEPKGKLLPAPATRLVERLGTLYTYRIISFNGELRVDLGFEIRRPLPEGHGLKEGDIIESIRKGDKYSFKKSKRSASDLYTYKARIERIVDGDTLVVVIDCGFITETRQYLRLRGIDCPEMSTEAGKKAKAWVEKELKGLDTITLVSSRSDKYDRYLADIYYTPKNSKEEKFLNQVLLDAGYAVRMSF